MAATFARTNATATVASTVARTKAHRRPEPVAAPSAATFRRRRAVAAVSVAMLSVGVLGLQGVLTGPGDVPASAAGAGTAPLQRAVRAAPGDTLWEIAEIHRGPVSMRRYLDALVERNGGSATIQAGQLVHLP